jgi:carboxyl-terminal processing protease
MKKSILITFFLINALILNAQSNSYQINDTVKKYLDTTLNIFQSNALNGKSVDWKVLRQEVYSKAQGAKSNNDILSIFPYIFEQLNDHHGSLIYMNNWYSWHPQKPAYSNVEINEAIKEKKGLSSQLINNNIGYILIPGNSDYEMKATNSIAQQIRDFISKINSMNVKAWIIDLRINNGGSMYPMLAGLGPLLGEGKIGGFCNQQDKVINIWFIKNGNLSVDSNQMSNIKEDFLNNNHRIPVAVLVSGRTASSGEIVAISMEGRPNTIIIGEPTAGYTTANSSFALNPYSTLNLATLYEVDRNNKAYKNKVIPDIQIYNGDNLKNLNYDLKVKAAIDWINNKTK